MEQEHFHDTRRFGSAALVRIAQPFGDLRFEEQTRHRKRLRPFVVEEEINVGDEFANPAVDCEALAKARDKTAGQGVTLIGFLVLVQTDRTNPEMRGPGHRVGGVQVARFGFFRGGVRIASCARH